ncbi:cytochrome b/b6 domain-containing protein [Methylovirgula sp. HY1]|uniref:cytochrome b/b6 domain-containing protein n=1 Tax=Methylovirgula sp. HY1 TaxID=2822761 RepID=UPI001C7799A7|nr:cytochrome b/b6 domain-containing protein [Methylovirgula sp. HY1]QXX76586.1 putative Ni/Fe-hydrogenase B-type cytochrome subunit [Methylovirgula sp. HY1]
MQTGSRIESSTASRLMQEKPRSVIVWDPVVRLFHWLVVAGFAMNMFVTEEGKPIHRWIGYAILVAVAIRLVWGFVGTVHARFSDFVPTSSRLMAYAKALLKGREPRYVGHNPAAALMIIVLILMLIACGVTGWMQGLDTFWGIEWVRELHEACAYAILVLATIHVLAAIVESLRHRENLILSMITGRKRAPGGTDIDHAAATD